VLPDWFRFPAAGELPQGFGFSLSPLVWTLDVLTPEQRRNRGGKSLALIGRLKRGVTASDAQADLAKIAADIARDFPGTNAGWTIRVMTLREQLVGSLRPALIALLTAVGLVLLIACANVANLLLVRTTARQREICLRYALGAPRSTLVWASLAESLLLAGAGGLAGLGIAWWMLRALLTMAPASLPAAAQAGLDWDVLVFTVVLSLVTGVLFGAVPAWHGTRYDTADGLREGSRGMVGGRGAARTRNALVVFEVALAVTLLIGSVLLVQTFVRLIHVNTGFRTDRILTMEIALPKTAYTPARASTFFVSLIERLAALPGVEAAGLTSGVPLSGSENLLPVTAEGQPRPQPGHEIISDYRVITAGYFEALGIPLLEGDSIQPSPDAPRVWINQTMARSAWPGRPAVGRRLKLTNYDRDAAWYTVAGVVGDTRYTGLDRALRPQVYVYFTQDPKEQMAIVLRSYGDPSLLVASARQAVQSLESKSADCTCPDDGADRDDLGREPTVSDGPDRSVCCARCRSGCGWPVCGCVVFRRGTNSRDGPAARARRQACESGRSRSR
jgi:putative ABC transport system permease protein